VERKGTLKNGREVVIRDMRHDDLQPLLDFFQALPTEDRKYLRVDLTQPEVVKARIRDVDAGRVKRLVALDGDRIVGDGALELEGHGWGDNVAEFRLIVAHSYQKLGLGTVLARELFFVAAAHKVERIVARFLRPQEGAHHILHRLGFHEEFHIPDQARDQEGRWQDVIIMRCNLEEIWNEMENVMGQEDWQSRYSAGRE
jgi:L-amino acid N-acyltransferase YncA